MKKLWILLMVPILILGCQGGTKADSDLLWQSHEAGKFIATQTDGTIKEAAMDIVANQKQLMDNLGAPAEQDQKPYSTEASKDAREKSKEEHKGKGMWIALAGVLLGATQLAKKFGSLLPPPFNIAVGTLSPLLSTVLAPLASSVTGFGGLIDGAGGMDVGALTGMAVSMFKQFKIDDALKVVLDKYAPWLSKLILVAKPMLVIPPEVKS